MSRPVVHFEIIGPDPSQLRDYYSRLFGWDATPGSPVAEGVSAPDAYAFVDAADGVGIPGGIGGGDGFAPKVLVYVGVPDVAAVLDEAELLGGRRLLGPVRSPNGLIVGQFRDPAGIVLGVAQLPDASPNS